MSILEKKPIRGGWGSGGFQLWSPPNPGLYKFIYFLNLQIYNNLPPPPPIPLKKILTYIHQNDKHVIVASKNEIIISIFSQVFKNWPVFKYIYV